MKNFHSLYGNLRLDKDASDAGGSALAEADFQKRVISTVESVGSKQDALLKDFNRLDASTKQHFEDLTQLKKVANDSAANFTAVERKLAAIDGALKNEVRAAFGSPLARIQNNEELRWRFNAAVRLAVSDNNGDMRSLVLKSSPDFIKKALGEDSSPGSTLISQQLAKEIYDTLQTYGIWNTFAVRRLGTKTNVFPVKTARVVALALASEGDQIADDASKTGTTVTATVVDIAALLNVYMRLIQDAEFDVTADVLGDFAEACAYRLDWMATQADGTADTTDGGMTGIFGGGGTAATAAAGNVTVQQTTLEDWQNVLLTVDAAVLNRSARWWMHPQQLVRALGVRDGNGRPLFQTALEAPAAGGIGSILGYPVTPGAVCPTTSAASAKIAVFGDPNGLVVGIRNDFEVMASDHHKWDYAMRSFRVIGRAAVKVRRAAAFGVLTLPAA